MAATLDIVPAQVRIDGKLHNRTRVVISDGRIHVLAMVQGVPTLLASAAVTDCLPCNGGPLNMVTVEGGDKYEVRRGGCNCGSARALGALDWREMIE